MLRLGIIRTMMAIVMAAVSICSFGQIDGPCVGDVAPDFQMSDSEGRMVKLSELRGKVVLLEFWASWSGPCRFETPEIVSLHNQYKGKKNAKGEELAVVFVSLDVRDGMWKKAIQSDKLEWAINLCDYSGMKGTAVTVYGASKLPCSYLIDGKGKIRGKNLRGDGLKSMLSILMDK